MKIVYNNKEVIYLIMASIVLYFFNLPGLKVSIMEARNFIVAREMLSEGNWIFTTLNGVARYEKPPMPAWFMTPFISLIGIDSLFAYRLPTSIMATIGVIICFFFVKDLSKNRELAFFSSIVLGSSFYYSAIRLEGPSDIYTHVFMFGAIFCLNRLFNSSERKYRYLLYASIMGGFSILSKGPVSPYALLLPYLISHFIVNYKRENRVRDIKFTFLFILFSFSIGFSWFMYVKLNDPDTFLAIASKEAGNWSSYNVRPFYYYWSFFSQNGVWALFSLVALIFYSWLSKRSEFNRVYKQTVYWTFISLILLSIIPEKKSRYLVPLLIPLAITTAVFIYETINNSELKNRILKYKLHFALYTIPGLIAILSPIIYMYISLDTTIDKVWYISTTILLTLTGVIIVQNSLKLNFKKAFYGIFVINLILSSLALYAVNLVDENPHYKNFNSITLCSKTPIFSFGQIGPEIIWEYGKIAPELSHSNIVDYSNFFIITNDYEQIEQLEYQIEELLKKDIELSKIADIDLNKFSGRGKKGYRERLTGDIYEVKIKQRETN